MVMVISHGSRKRPSGRALQLWSVNPPPPLWGAFCWTLRKTWETKTFCSHHDSPSIRFKQQELQLIMRQATVLALLPASVSANASQEAAAASMKAAKAAGKSAEASTRAANATEKSSRAVVGTSMANGHIDNRGNYCGPTDHFKGRSGGSQRGSRSR